MITLDTPLKFLAPGGHAPIGRGRWHLPAGDTPGEWMRDYKTKPVLCARGYHWCYAKDALHHLNAECYLIEPRGVTIHDGNKAVSQGGRLLRRVDAWNDRTARLFAADCAESVVHLCGDDPRAREAIAVARRFANGQATALELAAASATARATAWASAWASTSATARASASATASATARATAWASAWAAASATASAAASATASAAAWDAAWDAASATARDAAGAAAWDAAWAAAWDAAWDAEKNRFLQYINGEIA